MRLSRGDATDLVRSAGGLLLTAGTIVLFARKSGHHGWNDFALLLVVLTPAVVLYMLGLGALERPTADIPRAWQSVAIVASILLWPIALLQFLQLVGARTSHPLYVAGVFAATSLLAAYAARRARIRYAALLAGLSSLITWLYVWEEILHRFSANTGRWLLATAGALLLILAAGLARAKTIGASEIATTGGIATVAAGVLGVIVGGVITAFQPLFTLGEGVNESSAVATSASHFHPHPVGLEGMPRTVPHHPSSQLHSLAHIAHTSGLQHFGWDIYLLVVSVALICGAARWRIRGLGYVGGAGLLAFIISTAAQITRIETGHAPTSSIVGWPLTLIIAGVAGLAAPALSRRGT